MFLCVFIVLQQGNQQLSCVIERRIYLYQSTFIIGTDTQRDIVTWELGHGLVLSLIKPTNARSGSAPSLTYKI